MLGSGKYRVSISIEDMNPSSSEHALSSSITVRSEMNISGWLPQRSKFLAAETIDGLRDTMLAAVFNDDWRADKGNEDNGS